VSAEVVADDWSPPVGGSDTTVHAAAAVSRTAVRRLLTIRYATTTRSRSGVIVVSFRPGRPNTLCGARLCALEDRDSGYAAAMTTNPIQLQKYLGGVDYPTDKNTLIERAKEKGADDDVIRTLRNLPVDRFNSPNDVSEALGKK
jgi:hypothetical protein